MSECTGESLHYSLKDAQPIRGIETPIQDRASRKAESLKDAQPIRGIETMRCTPKVLSLIV